MKNKLILPAVAVLSVVGLAVGAVGASAHFMGQADNAEMTKTLAQKLGVSEDKIKQAFDDMHSERMTKMKADLESKLTQAVKDGKITEAQKSAILEKFGQVKVKTFEKKEGMTEDQIKAEMESRKKELETWAQQNGIDLQVLRELVGPKGKRGFVKHM